MPITIRKVPGGYQTRTPSGIKAKRTTQKMAQAQRRLIQGVEHGMVPRRRSK